MFVSNALMLLCATGSYLAFVAVVQATPLVRRDVIAPKILQPNANTVWTIGQVETVTWDTSNFPPDSQITNPNGQVILGHQENNSLNLDFNHPLASGFKLRDGSVQLTVPDVPPRDDYLIVLYGDSGNTSPAFTITRISGGSPPPSSSSISASGNAPPQTPVSSSSSSVTESASSSLSQVLTAGAPPPTASTPASSSTSTTSSPANPVASSNQSSGTSTQKFNMMALTSCMASAVFFLLA